MIQTNALEDSITINLTINKYKERMEKRANTDFLCGLSNSTDVHASKLIELEDSTIQAFTTHGLKMLTIDFQDVNKTFTI